MLADHEELRVRLHLAHTRRKRSLRLIAVLAGALLGYFSLVLDSLAGHFVSHADPIGDLAGLIGGGVIGFFSMPFVNVYLVKKDLRKALPSVYAVTLVVVSVVTILKGPFVAVPLGLFALALSCHASGLLFQSVFQNFDPKLCHACGYDLHSNVSGRCPECGAPCRSFTNPIQGDEHRDMLGERSLWHFVGRTIRHRVLVITVLMVIIFGLPMLRTLGPHFTPDRFKSIVNDMSEEEVRDVLGRPDDIRGRSYPTLYTWEYYVGGKGMFTDAIYGVNFSDGIVTGTEIDYW